jgi:hypothetical protein
MRAPLVRRKGRRAEALRWYAMAERQDPLLDNEAFRYLRETVRRKSSVIHLRQRRRNLLQMIFVALVILLLIATMAWMARF